MARINASAYSGVLTIRTSKSGWAMAISHIVACLIKVNKKVDIKKTIWKKQPKKILSNKLVIRGVLKTLSGCEGDQERLHNLRLPDKLSYETCELQLKMLVYECAFMLWELKSAKSYTLAAILQTGRKRLC